jgi:hypothetical protein
MQPPVHDKHERMVDFFCAFDANPQDEIEELREDAARADQLEAKLEQ